MKKRSVRATYAAFTRGMQRAHITVFAASGAFYIFLSLVPLVLLLLSLLPFTPLTKEDLSEFLLYYAPESFQTLIGTIVGEVFSRSFAALSISALVVLWSAAKIMSSLMLGVGEIYDGYRDRGFLRLRLLGALYTVILLVFIALCLSLFVFGNHLAEALEGQRRLCRLWQGALRFRAIVFILYLTLYNALLFKTIPQTKYPLGSHLPGAAFAAAAGLLFSKLFSWLIDRFNIYSMYGSLTIVVISMFWLYYTMYFFFLGAYVNTLILPPKKTEAGKK